MDVPEQNLRESDPLMLSPRRRERRRGVEQLTGVLARGVGERLDSWSMRAGFEEALRSALALRTVQLRDAGTKWAAPSDGPAGGTSLAFDVASTVPGARGLLTVTFEPGRRLDEWDYQALETSAEIAALVLEIDRRRLQSDRAAPSSALKQRRDGATPLIGSTPVMAALRARIERVAGTDFTVLLEGESGVGKELVARQIHDLSRRRNGPFVAVNCAALVETLLEAELFGIEERTATGVRGRRGKFEHADRGTLFLDEVSELSPQAQAKLLRALQDLTVERVGGMGGHRVDTRILAATNRGLATLVKQRLLRPDLFYRLSGVEIRVPPLRERRGDILELAQHFLERHRSTRVLALSDAAAEALVTYEWPGNVRELERLIEGAVALVESDVIEMEDLPLTVGGDYMSVLMPSVRRDDTMRAWGSRYATLVLARCHGNKRETCRVLGISYHTLASYLKNAAAAPEGHPVGAPRVTGDRKGTPELCAAEA